MKPAGTNSLILRICSPLLNLTIGWRLSLAFLGVFVLMTVMAVFASYNMYEMNKRMAHITEGNNQQIDRVNQMIDSVSQRAIAVRNLTLLTDPALKKEELASIELAAKEYSKAESELLALIEKFDASEAEKALMEAIKRSEKTVGALTDQAIELGMANKTEEAIEFLMEKVRPRQARWITVLQTLAGLQAKTSLDYTEDSNLAYVKARNLLIVFVAVALLAGLVLAWAVTLSITKPLGQAIALAKAAARGSLTVRVTSTSRDETGQLLASLQAMNENLVRVVSDVRLSSERIVTGTTEIAGGNLDLSHRTERQAASLEETAATMQEIRAAVHNNSETARQASAMAKSASAAAVKGGQVVNQVVKTMEEITSSSKRIEDITGVIDGIAFQTNILALNAAVEAARAGEQGRGFAVVASEVRSLAQRSASAAKEIKGLITASAETVSTGSRLVSEAGGNMADLVSQVGRLATLISEISSATNLQTTGMDQMGDAITGLDQVTQQNAALVEESAAASESLKLQAERLMESVQVFKLSEQEDVQGLLLSNSLSFQQNSLTTSTQRSFS